MQYEKQLLKFYINISYCVHATGIFLEHLSTYRWSVYILHDINLTSNETYQRVMITLSVRLLKYSMALHPLTSVHSLLHSNLSK